MPGRRDFTLKMGLEGAATIVTGLNQLIQLVGRVVAKVKEVASEIDDYSDVVSGHAVSIDQARIATSGLIDSIELHRTAARLEAAGIQVTAEQLRGLSVAAADFANRTGADMTETFNELTTAVLAGTDRGLMRYSVALDAGTTRAQRQAQALNELTERFENQTIEVGNTNDAITALQNSWSDAWHEMALAVESSSGIIGEAIGLITDQLRDVTNGLEAQRRATADLRRLGVTGRMAEVQRQLESRGMVLGAGGWEAGEGSTARTAWDILRGQSAAETGAEIRALLDEYRRLRSQEQQDIERIGVMTPEPERPGAREAAPPRRGGGRAAPSAQPLGEYLSGPMQTLYDDLERRAGEWQERQEEIVSDDVDRWAKRTDELTAFFADLDAQQATSAEMFARAEESKREAIEATTSAMEAQAKSAERSVSTFETISNVMSALGGVVDQVSGIITAAAGADSRAAEVMKKVRGAFLIAEAVVQAALEAARAAASFAEQDYTGGAMHTIAAAMYVAAAIKAGVEMGASSKTGTSTGSARAYPEHRGGQRGERQEQQSVVVNINGPVTSRRVNEDVEDMRRGSSRYYG